MQSDGLLLKRPVGPGCASCAAEEKWEGARFAQMTFQQFFLALRYRWRTALVVWAATLLVVVPVASLLIPTRYRASSELLIEEANSDPIAGVAMPGSSLPSRILT